MGLDSVELVMEFENYFNIRIPDQQAEKMATIQEAIDVVADLRSITSDDTELRDSVLGKIQDILIGMELTDKQLLLSDFISNFLSPLQKEKWELFENQLGLEVPKPEVKIKEPTGFWNQIKHLATWTPPYEWAQITVEHFIAAVCSRNCPALINPKEIKTKYEILVAIMNITVDKSGVDEYEIKPEKSFTNDLGID